MEKPYEIVFCLNKKTDHVQGNHGFSPPSKTMGFCFEYQNGLNSFT